MAARQAGGRHDDALLQLDTEQRGGHNRKLSLEKQRALREEVVRRFRAEEPVVDRDIQLLAQQLGQLEHPRDTRAHSDWQPLRAWAWAFKQRWQLSARRPRTLAPGAEFDAAADGTFTDQCQLWLRRVGPHNFLNLDETSWKLANPSLLTIAPIGERCRVFLGANHRTCFTLSLIVSATGHKLQPTVVKRCKTAAGLRPIIKTFGNKVHAVGSQKGWSNAKILINIINNIIVPYTQREQAALILDVFAGHTTPAVCKALQDANIVPLWVPAGSTATRQPLDVVVMGVLKDIARRRWQEDSQRLIGAPRRSITQLTAMGHALAAWRSVSRHLIHEAFKRALDLPSLPNTPTHPLRQYLAPFPANKFASASAPTIKRKKITVAIRRDLTKFVLRPPTNKPPTIHRRGRKKQAKPKP